MYFYYGYPENLPKGTLTGVAKFRGRFIAYTQGLVGKVVSNRKLPDLSDTLAWNNFLLEILERRQRNIRGVYAILSDNLWSFFETIWSSHEGNHYDLAKPINPEQLKGVNLASLLSPNAKETRRKRPSVYINEIENLFNRGIDAEPLHAQELIGQSMIEFKRTFRNFIYLPGEIKKFIESKKHPGHPIQKIQLFLEYAERKQLNFECKSLETEGAIKQLFEMFYTQCLEGPCRSFEYFNIKISDIKILQALPMFAKETQNEAIVKQLIYGENKPQLDRTVLENPKPSKPPLQNHQPPKTNQAKQIQAPQSLQPLQPQANPFFKPQAIANKTVPSQTPGKPPILPTSASSSEIAKLPINGDFLGSGQALKQIGAGGMGVVYKTYNQGLDVHRAVKLLNLDQIPPTKREQASERIITEAQISAKLTHPNIIPVYNVGTWQEQPFLEMAYIDGEDFEKISNSVGRLPPLIVCAVAIEVCKALAYAHSQTISLYGKVYKGIIHRDLKPSNIMLSSEGEIKLMDFGIARPAEASIHTADNSVTGTLQYSAYEQLCSRPVDGRSDLFALGAILYELLVAKKVFPQKAFNDLMQARAKNEFVSLKKYKLKAPQELISLIHQCLSDDTDKRPESADDLREYLEFCFSKYTNSAPQLLIKTWQKEKGSETQSLFGFKKRGLLAKVFG